MAFFVPKIYSAMAFDAGRITSGPMNSSFVLPFAIGAAITFIKVTDKYNDLCLGVNALVTMVPIITIQALGLYVTAQENAAFALPDALCRRKR
jgi:hypothetical protein